MKEKESVIEPISLFDEQALAEINGAEAIENSSRSALPETAIEEWKSFYTAVSQYAKQLNPQNRS